MREVFVQATFSAVALEEGMEWWVRHLWPGCKLTIGGFDTLFQCVFDPDSQSLADARGTLVLALDSDSMQRLGNDDALGSGAFREGLAQLAQQPDLNVILAILHGTDSANNEAAQELTTIPGIVSLGPADIDRFLSGAALAPRATAKAAGIPYTRDYLAAVTTAVAWRIDQLERPLKKVLVLDCDHTLWSGVVAEDGVNALVLEERHQRLARLAGRLREAGWLVCLCSKNELADVREAFKALDLGLAWDDLAAVRVNWDDKASNLRSLAEELDLGLDSFVFVDDNPVECASVSAALPEVSVLHMDPGADNQWLERVWLFEPRETTPEDAQRARFYARNRQREALRHTLGSASDFVEALAIEMSVEKACAKDAARIAQLSLRTNQFNFSGLKLQEQEISDQLQRAGSVVLRATLRDRFGDYGLVGAALAQLHDDQLFVDGLWLSCRALGRGVEHAMVRRLGAEAHKAGRETLGFRLRELPRNVPARRFAQTLQTSPASASRPGDTIQIPADLAQTLRFDPDQVSTDKPEAPRAPTVTARKSSDYGLIARTAMDRELIRAIEGEVVPRPGLQRSFAAPRSSLERTLARIWSETLSLDAVGIFDEFDELGGRSIQLVTIHARIRDRLGHELEFVDLFRFTSVSALASHLEGRTAGRSMDAVTDRGTRQRRASGGFRRIDRSGLRA